MCGVLMQPPPPSPHQPSPHPPSPPLLHFLSLTFPPPSNPLPPPRRCYLSVLLMCEVLVAGIDADCHSLDWSVHVPLMLHVIVLGLDHSRPIVYQHCEWWDALYHCSLGLTHRANVM